MPPPPGGLLDPGKTPNRGNGPHTEGHPVAPLPDALAEVLEAHIRHRDPWPDHCFRRGGGAFILFSKKQVQNSDDAVFMTNVQFGRKSNDRGILGKIRIGCSHCRALSLKKATPPRIPTHTIQPNRRRQHAGAGRVFFPLRPASQMVLSIIIVSNLRQGKK